MKKIILAVAMAAFAMPAMAINDHTPGDSTLHGYSQVEAENSAEIHENGGDDLNHYGDIWTEVNTVTNGVLEDGHGIDSEGEPK